jgi:glucose-1-phosphate adenylyltransferase
MQPNECIAMILAGGQGSRLRALTTTITKPAVPFGAKHRLIDFTLSNCFNSGIDTVGVLTAPEPFALHRLMPPDHHNNQRGTSVYPLSPSGNHPYKGTADAIFANIPFIDEYNPEYILVLSGDHLYKMDYGAMLSYHRQKEADVTIAAIGVPWSEASRFGVMAVSSDGSITEFTEKPPQPKSNLVSMGVYAFTWAKLKKHLLADAATPASCHDFGKDVIPAMLSQGENLFAYTFGGYWKDVGTVETLYQAHMDLLGSPAAFTLHDEKWPIYTTYPEPTATAIRIASEANCLIHPNSIVRGRIEGTVLFSDVYVGPDAVVKNSVLMPGAYIGSGAYIERALIGPGAVIDDNYTLQGGLGGLYPIAVARENMIYTARAVYASNR